MFGLLTPSSPSATTQQPSISSSHTGDAAALEPPRQTLARNEVRWVAYRKRPVGHVAEQDDDGDANANAIKRPYLRIEFKTSDGAWQTFDAIVDSGADFSALDASMMRILGVDVGELRREKARNVGGWTWAYRDAPPIRARLASTTNEFELQPVFIERRKKRKIWKVLDKKQRPQDPILGRLDFGVYFDIALLEREQRLYLRWRGVADGALEEARATGGDPFPPTDAPTL